MFEIALRPLDWISFSFFALGLNNPAIMSTNIDPEKHSFDPDVEKSIPDPLADAIRNGSIDKKILEHSHDADEAMKAFQESQGQVIEIDAATNKRLLRRIDWNLMPVCTLE